jgi:hypothetical protein
LCVIPVSGLWLTPFQPNSGAVVLPTITVPACCRRVTDGVLSAGTWPCMVNEPYSHCTPATGCRSLMVTGTPVSGPAASPRRNTASAARACASAISGAVSVIAFSCGSSRPIWRSTACATSTGDSDFARYRRANSVAGRKPMSSSSMPHALLQISTPAFCRAAISASA